MLGPSVTAAAALFLRHGFPGRSALVNRLSRDESLKSLWKAPSLRWVKSSVHGLYIPCDARISTGRTAYLLGRWYENSTQSVILGLLGPGDVFIDIGANVGMASLTAAAAVGPEGRIVAFEPNPDTCAILRSAIAKNGLANVTVHNAAVGLSEGRFRMFVPDSNHGEASLGTDFDERPGKVIEVEVVDGAGIEGLGEADMIKIDVEGFEEQVLRALSTTLRERRPIVFTELAPHHLRRCGSSPEALVSIMTGHGYSGLVPHQENVGSFKMRAVLKPLGTRMRYDECNVLWVPEERVARVLENPLRTIPR